MTGAQILAQVREALHSARCDRDFCLAALDGCVLLTAEEQDTVRRVLLVNDVKIGEWKQTHSAALALLTPEQP